MACKLSIMSCVQIMFCESFCIKTSNDVTTSENEIRIDVLEHAGLFLVKLLFQLVLPKSIGQTLRGVF